MYFRTEAELLAHYETSGEAWLALIAADSDPYLLACTEDGDLFTQTIRTEENESGTSWLHEHDELWYPVKLIAPLPEETL